MEVGKAKYQKWEQVNSVNVWMEEQIPFQVISTTEVRHIIPRVSQRGGGDT